MGTITPTIAASKRFGMADLGKVTGTVTSLEMVGGTIGSSSWACCSMPRALLQAPGLCLQACSVVMLVFLLVRAHGRS